MMFRARSPLGHGKLPEVEIDEQIEVTFERKAITERDRQLSARVFDRVFIGPDGNEHREWVGTPEELAACAKVNPLTAALFSMADRVRVSEGRDGIKWLRKSDGAELEQVIDDVQLDRPKR